MIKIIKIFESQHSDGYHHYGDKVFFDSYAIAEQWSKYNHNGYAAPPATHDAVEVEGKLLLLKNTDPVYLYSSKKAKDIIIEQALSKLTATEKEALGL